MLFFPTFKGVILKKLTQVKPCRKGKKLDSDLKKSYFFLASKILILKPPQNLKLLPLYLFDNT